MEIVAFSQAFLRNGEQGCHSKLVRSPLARSQDLAAQASDIFAVGRWYCTAQRANTWASRGTRISGLYHEAYGIDAFHDRLCPRFCSRVADTDLYVDSQSVGIAFERRKDGQPYILTSLRTPLGRACCISSLRNPVGLSKMKSRRTRILSRGALRFAGGRSFPLVHNLSSTAISPFTRSLAYYTSAGPFDTLWRETIFQSATTTACSS